MKMIISIPDDAANKPLENNLDFTHTMLMALMTGKRLPDNPTNGDMIKAMFNCMVIDIVREKVYVEKIYFPFDEGWWNAPYKGGEENGKQKNPTQK